MQLPCKDCITLACCKSKVSHIKDRGFRRNLITCGTLLNICSLLNSYLKSYLENGEITINSEKVKKVGEFFHDSM